MTTLDSAVPFTTWGAWTFDRDRLVLMHAAGYGYEVDLERCRSSAEVLDWIAQVQGKTWCTRGCVGSLVEALCDLLRPQQSLCSFGTDSSLPTDAIGPLVLENERRTLSRRLRDSRRPQPDGGMPPRVGIRAGDLRREMDSARAEIDARFGEA